MKTTEQSAMRLYSTQGQRLYVNKSERIRFEKIANKQSTRIKLFCLILLYTGCRVSEAINLKQKDFQLAEGTLAIKSLKKRNTSHVREIPIPNHLVVEIQNFLVSRPNQWQQQPWKVHRSTAWEWVKRVMKEAHIEGAHASPKGLRHGYGVNAVMCNIGLSVLKKWMGHSCLKTTEIYTQIVGKEERQLAKRMW